MEAAVKIQGRTFHFLGKDTQGYGLNYYTHKSEAGVEEHVGKIAQWGTKKEKADLIFAKGSIRGDCLMFIFFIFFLPLFASRSPLQKYLIFFEKITNLPKSFPWLGAL